MSRNDPAVDPARGGLRAHLFLIGFMGAGKTTVARHLAALLGAAEIELDEEIVRECGKNIPEIFEAHEEAYFRDRESEALRSVIAREPAVISCGGGCVLREENVAAMRESGTVVLLSATAETIYERIKNQGNRPLLAGQPTREKIAAMMEERRAAYEKACDVTVSTDGKSPGQIAEEIIGMIR